jgi:hypothetical protein
MRTTPVAARMPATKAKSRLTLENKTDSGEDAVRARALTCCESLAPNDRHEIPLHVFFLALAATLQAVPPIPDEYKTGGFAIGCQAYSFGDRK